MGEAIVAMSRRVAAAASRARPETVAVVLLAGEPYPDGGLGPKERLRARHRNTSALRALCEELPVDLVFLDPAFSAADVEIAVLLEHCPPLRWVVVNNVNLPGFAGWVRE